LSIWSSITPSTTPDPLDFIPCRDQYGRPLDGDTRYVDVATSFVSTVCRLSIDEADVFLSAEEVAELIARLTEALTVLVFTDEVPA